MFRMPRRFREHVIPELLYICSEIIDAGLKKHEYRLNTGIRNKTSIEILGTVGRMKNFVL